MSGDRGSGPTLEGEYNHILFHVYMSEFIIIKKTWRGCETRTIEKFPLMSVYTTNFYLNPCRKEPVPEPQPDNRDGNEVCIGVLNNFYADGVKWHDVACHHRKPTICQL